MLKFISILSVIICIAIGCIALPFLPDEVFIHWNTEGTADIQVSKYIGVLIIPLIMIFSWGLHLFLMRNHHQPLSYSIIFNVIIFLLMQVLLILINLDLLQFHVEISGVIIGVVMLIMAPLMRNIKMNALFGVRTVWSMKNEESWRKSNKFGSNLLFAWGVFTIIISFLLPSEYVIPTALSVGLLIVIVIVYGSYRFYKNSI